MNLNPPVIFIWYSNVICLLLCLLVILPRPFPIFVETLSEPLLFFLYFVLLFLIMICFFIVPIFSSNLRYFYHCSFSSFICLLSNFTFHSFFIQFLVFALQDCCVLLCPVSFFTDLTASFSGPSLVLYHLFSLHCWLHVPSGFSQITD